MSSVEPQIDKDSALGLGRCSSFPLVTRGVLPRLWVKCAAFLLVSRSSFDGLVGSGWDGPDAGTWVRARRIQAWQHLI